MYREDREKAETNQLSEYAIKSVQAIRVRTEDKHPYRTEFQRDRDRILYSKYFRLLMHKTQVFPSPELTFIRNRLTHTLEVTQIARTISRSLRLNEDLTEAIGLGHDLGHPPFGHAGEEALKEKMKDCNGFEHNEQSLRIVEKLENLNLTNYTCEGILRHTKPDEKFYKDNKITRDLSSLTKRFGYPDQHPTFFEAQVVDIADEIAYLTHDLEDLLHLELIELDEIPKKWRERFGLSRKDAINGLVSNVVHHADKLLTDGIKDQIKTVIIFDDEIKEMANDVKGVFNSIYQRPPLAPKEVEARHYIELLFDYWNKQSCKELPKEISKGIAMRQGEPQPRCICDCIVEKTDQEITELYTKMFSPKTSLRG
jgi:dGTPase